eukprot:CAMPEP_0119569486 /NCGR_PEP_ID=MMETSP1352-20130426/41759_1 /TAXON_ID=265584 /ORGANISM="Stauroneis constricta, Strain CCMP1120" /LENGTH=280 /DNA_ID=CAMNT_0007619041 /DNA_START=110 /DNA_END=952 /DNA_ORIENTATION=+
MTLAMLFAKQSCSGAFRPTPLSSPFRRQRIGGLAWTTLGVVTDPTSSSSSSSSVSSNSFRFVSSTSDDSAAQGSDSTSPSSSLLDPLVVCGPSGVGKGTIINKYINELGGKEKFGFGVSHTTRQPREGEVDGVHYHFTTIDEIKESISKGKFLEHAEVHGNYYGTSWAALRDVQDLEHKRCLLDIDVQGVKNLKRLEDDALLKPKYLFIAPPSLDVLHSRLVSRGSETAESLERRRKNAVEEMVYGMKEGNFDAIVVNNDLDKAVEDFAAAVNQLYGSSS